MRDPDDYWGIGSIKRAAEMKHRRNTLNPAEKWSGKDIKKLRDALETKRAKYAYYLVFVDEDIDTEKRKARYKGIREFLGRQAKEYPRMKILCVARSGVKDARLN